MGQPHPTNDGGHINTLCSPLLILILFILLLRFKVTPNAHCKDQRPNMAIYKRSDAAASSAANSKTSIKASKPNARTPKATQETGQQNLCPQQNSGSPTENDTNSHIATIN